MREDGGVRKRGHAKGKSWRDRTDEDGHLRGRRRHKTCEIAQMEVLRRFGNEYVSGRDLYFSFSDIPNPNTSFPFWVITGVSVG